jgi:murein L,D-transpeptidase YcbB/YkuD
MLDEASIRSELKRLAREEHVQTVADDFTRNYYSGIDSLHYVWLSRNGINDGADSLLAWLQIVDEEGLSKKSFCVKEIAEDLQRLKNLDFDGKENNINSVAARFEYHLTKACLRYTYGQRFGFVNPYRAYNMFDIEKDSTSRTPKTHGLYDIVIDQPTKDYAWDVLRKVGKDSIAAYLREIQPKGTLYSQLKSMLAKADSADADQRQRIICNMERCRWRNQTPINDNEKHIVVNIPAFHLYAKDGGQQTLDMKIVCGAVKTKSPQLSSRIEYFELNPKWVIPYSIIKNDVAHHAGDGGYFARHRYDIVNTTTGQQVSGDAVTRQMLLSGNYRVAQKGGSGNSLGRIVFRFKNSFAVYLHDTSTPSAFNREVRALSHGCIRLSKPFDLSQFVLNDPDEWLADRIRMAMGKPAQTQRGKRYVSEHTDEEVMKVITRVPVNPSVPVHIIYYTMYYDETGVLQNWKDIYGFDALILKHLQPYRQ